MDAMEIINIVALVLTTIALGITVFQLNRSFSDSKELRTINKNLQDQISNFEKQNIELLNIKDSLSTKYLGIFPHFVDNTIELLKSAKESIEIVCDFPCYCYFSNYEKHLHYKLAIESLRTKKGHKISLTCPGEKERRELVIKQFRMNSENKDFWKHDKEVSEKLEDFIKNENLDTTANEITQEIFLDKIEERNKATLNGAFSNKIKEISVELPIYYWIVDGKKAIFSIPSFSEFNREQGFFTTDEKLISALRTINDDLIESENTANKM